MKTLILFGASGSIGASTLAILREYGASFDLAGLSVHSHTEKLAEWIAEFRPERVAITDAVACAAWAAEHPGHAGLLLPQATWLEGLLGVEADIAINGVLGFAGLRVTLAALERNLDVALANKESLVCGGDLLLERLGSSRGSILPVDSEHSALWRLLAGVKPETIRRVILTASGGPFQDFGAAALAAVTPAQALAHPTWKMGPKITVDSATLMNKGLEVIEASLLFGIPAERVDVLVHPSSTVHALLETIDSAVYCQMSLPDMRQPILQALAHPEIADGNYGRLDLSRPLNLEFRPLDEGLFPAVALARGALARGGTAPLALNAADEVAVAAFLAGRIGFTQIVETARAVLDAADWASAQDFTGLVEADSLARKMSREHIGQSNRTES